PLLLALVPDIAVDGPGSIAMDGDRALPARPAWSLDEPEVDVPPVVLATDVAGLDGQIAPIDVGQDLAGGRCSDDLHRPACFSAEAERPDAQQPGRVPARRSVPEPTV